jgi:predicted TIM-barrel fold metal-dependent hydrolase
MSGNTDGFSKIRDGQDEPILDPAMPIIDTLHHLFDRGALRFMLEDYLACAGLGHNIVATVYVETQAMMRADGPPSLRPLGEIEFATGVAAMAASGVYGKCRVAAGIVGYCDMTQGCDVGPMLDRAMAIAPERFRGVRQIALAHPDPNVLRFLTNRPPADLLKHPEYPNALKQLARRNLSFEATVLHHQMPELTSIAALHPQTQFVLSHMGLATAGGVGPDARAEVFTAWRDNLRALARLANVVCKIGGLGTSYWGFGFNTRAEPAGSAELADAWKPYIETAIEAFGPDRCMMESDYPNDGRSCGFVPLWNAYKLVLRNHSKSEKAALFHGTAARFYRLDLP